jgi:hypothetical protein
MRGRIKESIIFLFFPVIYAALFLTGPGLHSCPEREWEFMTGDAPVL